MLSSFSLCILSLFKIVLPLCTLGLHFVFEHWVCASFSFLSLCIVYVLHWQCDSFLLIRASLCFILLLHHTLCLLLLAFSFVLCCFVDVLLLFFIFYKNLCVCCVFIDMGINFSKGVAWSLFILWCFCILVFFFSPYCIVFFYSVFYIYLYLFV